MKFYAHTAENEEGRTLYTLKDGQQTTQNPGLTGLAEEQVGWQPLKDHLCNVAKLAKWFAAPLGMAQDAELAGLLHDLGKYSTRFQGRLRDPSIHGVNHWAAGATCAADLKAWRVAFAADGHHTGIPALNNGDVARPLRTTVQSFKDPGRRNELTGQCLEPLDELLSRLREDGLNLDAHLPHPITDKFAESFHTRMAFSCLVDADFLDTEKHFDPKQSANRATAPDLEPARALEILKSHLATKPTDGYVNALRRQLLHDCLNAAQRLPGLFTLTAPTGSGKTLASLAFALQHIVHHNAKLDTHDPRLFRRIIVVIPYTSIIEQTARVYRDEIFEADFGEDYVLEHHSAVAPREREKDQGSDAEGKRLWRARLAAENWAFPLVVTTSVQFFESLFSNRPSDCRKLHNIARSVVLFDEVQTLPPHLLPSLLSAVHLLTRDYGVTAVFMTATQPAFASAGDALPYGWAPEPISTNEAGLAEALRRTRIELPRQDEHLTWAEVASKLAGEPQALCVVNTTRDAKELFRLISDLGPEGAFHLSARMCPAHRQRELKYIRKRLAANQTCRLVSTQLIEAGVDVDFPLAYRALGPLDSILQTAGRCNREGRSTEPCPVTVFRPSEMRLPPGAYKLATNKTQEFLARHPNAPLYQPEVYQEYFAELYRLVGPDKAEADRVVKLSIDLDFPGAANACQLVGNDTRAVLVKWGRGLELAAILHQQKYLAASECREAQRFCVNLYQSEFLAARAKGYIYQPAADWGFWVWNSDYNEHFGLGHLDAESYCQ